MKYNLKHTKFQIIIEIVSILTLISIFAVLLIRWKELPDQLPAHYNAAGEINRWGNKSELFILPVTSTIMYILLTIIGNFPSLWNMPVTVTEENRNRVYGYMRSMLILLKVELMGIFFYLNFNSMEARPLSPLFLPIVLISVFGTTLFCILKTVKISKHD